MDSPAAWASAHKAARRPARGRARGGRRPTRVLLPIASVPGAIERSVFGRVFDGGGWGVFGGVLGASYWLALRVVAMGDVCAVGVAQAMRRALALQQHGCLSKAEELTYGLPRPVGKTLEGVSPQACPSAAVAAHLACHFAAGICMDPLPRFRLRG